MSFTFVVPKSVNVSARIGVNEVTIYGYTSPNSVVELENYLVYSKTYSDPNGFFKFSQILLPKNPPDLCLSATDLDYRHTVPVCIPPPPPIQYHTNIGPIILPPSLTLDQSSASGQSLPNSTVSLHFYQEKPSAPLLVKPANAFSLPLLQTTSDSLGNFSLNLPNIYSTNYRLFATVNYQDNSSPKSNTLSFSLPPIFNLYLLIPFVLTLIIFLFLLFLSRRHPKRYLPAIIKSWPALPF